jgi:hypothetical protein
LIGGAAIVLAIAWITTGSAIPSGIAEAVLVQNSLLLVVFGSSLVERHFTVPSEAIVNSISALITLLAARNYVSGAIWWGVVSYLLVVLSAGLLVVAGQSSAEVRRPAGRAHRLAFQLATKLGRARVVFSVVFLAAAGLSASNPQPLTIWLLAFWAIFVVVGPSGPLAFVDALRGPARTGPALIGEIERVDSPGLVRVRLASTGAWRTGSDEVVEAHFDADTVGLVAPLYLENRGVDRWGVGLLVAETTAGADHHVGNVFERNSGEGTAASRLLAERFGFAEPLVLAGVVVEDSSGARVVVEVLPSRAVATGDVFAIPRDGKEVVYQVVSALTREEPFGDLRFGSIRAVAHQIGVLDANGTWRRVLFTPQMNTPVFVPSSKTVDTPVSDTSFALGEIAGLPTLLHGDFVDRLESHTAVLGATGTGKTEFAFDLIRNAYANDVKVVCIDLTGQYGQRLVDLAPVDLSVDAATAKKLGDMIFDADTGKYGGGEEKKALDAFATPLRTDIAQRLGGFLGNPGGSVGLITLPEISNTKATLWTTEMYLSGLLEMARRGQAGGSKVLVVVEEAHTVMPESSFAGVGDYDTKGTLAKIAQIALQGRKYGVGLLVVAQRTATVSKSVLTQCNTIVSFSCVDDTSINFLSHLYGEAVARSLPQLPRLHAVAHGDWIRSEGPLVFKVPYSEEKAALGAQPFKPAFSRTVQGVAAQAASPPTAPPPSDPWSDEPPF